MTDFSYHNGLLYAEDIAVPDLAYEYGTPLYIYSASHIRRQFHDFRQAMTDELGADFLIAYACKANDRLGVMSLIKEMGGGIDIVSGGELKKARAADVPLDKIIFSGVGKSDAELKLALETGIRQINIESEAELHRLIALADELKTPMNVLFRLNPDVEAGTHDKISTGRGEDKFGISDKTIKELYPLAAKSGYLTPRGISLHIGSQVSDARYFIPAFDKIAKLVTDLREHGQKVSELDLGGGLGITYRDEPPADLAGYAKLVKDKIAPLGCHLGFEPGRFLVGNAGILVSEILTVKDTEVKTHIVMDAGMNDLIRPTLYDAWHTVIPVAQPDETTPMIEADLVGPVCETGDTFARDRVIPHVKEGDLLAVQSAGAYCATMASYYNARPPATEIMVDGDQSRLLYRPPSIDEWIKREENF